MKINNTGHTVKILYDCDECDSINGLLLQRNTLYVVHKNGTVAGIHPHTGQLHNVYHIPDVKYIQQYCSLLSGPFIPNPEILLLPDIVKKEVFSYNLTSGEKQVHVTGISKPKCVSYFFLDGFIHYIALDKDKDIINIYNSSWEIELAFGGTGSGEDAAGLTAVVMSSNGSIIVSEFQNNHISVFSLKGEYLNHLQTGQVQSPLYLSYFEPYLWIKHYIQSEYRHGLYRYWLGY